MFLYDWRSYMYAYVWFLEAEPDKHPVIIKSRIGISGHLEIIGAFSGARRCRPYRGSHLRQIALRFFWARCYVCVYFTGFAFCHGCILPLLFFFIAVEIVISPATLGTSCFARQVDIICASS